MRAGILCRRLGVLRPPPARREGSQYAKHRPSHLSDPTQPPSRHEISTDAPEGVAKSVENRLDFTNNKEVYTSMAAKDLLRAVVVLQACQIQPLVKNADSILDMANRVFGSSIVNQILRWTFYNHFCAGEDENAIRPRIHALRDKGVGSILDYAAEADEDSSSTGPTTSTEKIYADMQSRIMEDGGADVARKYHYEGEAACDAHVDVFKRCIETVHSVSPGGFAAIKLTALGPPALLKRMSTAIIEIRNLFDKFDVDNNDGILTKDEFVMGYRKFFTDSKVGENEDDNFGLERLLHSLDPNDTNSIDFVEWSNQLRLEHLPALTSRCRTAGPLKSAVLTEWEMQAVLDMSERIHELAKTASDLEVRLMVDAEQTYFQPAIDNTVYGLQELFNAKTCPTSGKPGQITVFNTYQLYLKDATTRLLDDLMRAKRKNYFFGAKLVRGAYMVSERQRAEEMGYPSPIQDTLEDTHAAYNQAIMKLLQSIADGDQTEFMIASHNQESVEYAIEQMIAMGIPADKGVHFGQLLGMADHVTLLLGSKGYNVHKYVPYGHVGEVIPYLLRRAQENSTVLGTATIEISMMQRELLRRTGLPLVSAH